MAASINVEQLIPLIQSGVVTAGQIASAAVAAKNAKKKKEKSKPAPASPPPPVSVPAPSPAPSGQSPIFWPLALATLGLMVGTVILVALRRPKEPAPPTSFPTRTGGAYGDAFRR